MKLKLKEDPREWQKFTAVIACLLAVIVFLFVRRGLLNSSIAKAVWVFLGAALLFCVWRPFWFREFYRKGMTATFYVGKFVSAILLTFFFLTFVTLLGLLLRILGKDLLGLNHRDLDSHWEVPKQPGPLDRQF